MPVEAVRNKQILDLEAQIGISANTLHRLFNENYDRCKKPLGKPHTQTAICEFLGYESWDVLMAELEFATNPTKIAKELAELRRCK